MVFLEGSRNRLGSPDWTAALYKKTARQELLHSLATFAMPDKLPKRDWNGWSSRCTALYITCTRQTRSQSTRRHATSEPERERAIRAESNLLRMSCPYAFRSVSLALDFSSTLISRSRNGNGSMSTNACGFFSGARWDHKRGLAFVMLQHRSTGNIHPIKSAWGTQNRAYNTLFLDTQSEAVKEDRSTLLNCGTVSIRHCASTSSGVLRQSGGIVFVRASVRLLLSPVDMCGDTKMPDVTEYDREGNYGNRCSVTSSKVGKLRPRSTAVANGPSDQEVQLHPHARRELVVISEREKGDRCGMCRHFQAWLHQQDPRAWKFPFRMEPRVLISRQQARRVCQQRTLVRSEVNMAWRCWTWPR